MRSIPENHGDQAEPWLFSIQWHSIAYSAFCAGMADLCSLIRMFRLRLVWPTCDIPQMHVRR